MVRNLDGSNLVQKRKKVFCDEDFVTANVCENITSPLTGILKMPLHWTHSNTQPNTKKQSESERCTKQSEQAGQVVTKKSEKLILNT